MQRKGEICTLLMGLQIGAATVKIPQKIKNRTTTQSNNSTLQYLSKENENTNLKRYMHPYTLAWIIPWTEEPGRLQSMGSLGVGHD